MRKLISCPRCGAPVDPDKIGEHHCVLKQVADPPRTREDFWRTQEDLVDKILPLVQE